MANISPILRQYETVILVRPDATDVVQNDVRDRVDEIIAGAGGRVARWETWGKRRLAYEVRKQNKAFYLYSNFVSSQSSVYEIERNLRIMEPVIKFQTIKLEDQVDLETFDFDTVGAERTALYLSPEDAAAIERNYQREREWADGARAPEDATDDGADAAPPAPPTPKAAAETPDTPSTEEG